jgi:hypothetical protein
MFDITTLKNKISTQEIFFIEEGKKEYNFFKADVEDALCNNTFNEHYIFSSKPGSSKTYTTNEVAKSLNIPLIKFEGTLGLFAFCAEVATVLVNAPNDDSKIYCNFDDCDSLFTNESDLNVIKGMFDPDRQTLTYKKTLGGQYASLDDTQKAAIDHFRQEGVSGFSIPTDRLVFIVLTNKHFPGTDELEKVAESHKTKASGLAAIRRRVQYKSMDLPFGVDWGYCAYILLNHPLAEKWKSDITFDQKLEILKFTSPTNQWGKLYERNLSTFDKMVKDMVRFPDNYYDRWISQYVKNS